jgi:hypothetical protein
LAVKSAETSINARSKRPLPQAHITPDPAASSKDQAPFEHPIPPHDDRFHPVPTDDDPYG